MRVSFTIHEIFTVACGGDSLSGCTNTCGTSPRIAAGIKELSSERHVGS